MVAGRQVRCTRRVSVRRVTRTIRRGEIVGHLVVSGPVHVTLALRAFGSLAPPTLLQRLR